MQLCSRDTASNCSRVVSCCASLAALLMSAMALSSSVRAADSRAKSRYSKSLQSLDRCCGAQYVKTMAGAPVGLACASPQLENMFKRASCAMPAPVPRKAHAMAGGWLRAPLRCTCAVVMGRARASPEAPSAPPVAALDEGQQLAPGQEEAAEARQDAVQVSLQLPHGLRCIPLCLQAPQVSHSGMGMMYGYSVWATMIL